MGVENVFRDLPIDSISFLLSFLVSYNVLQKDMNSSIHKNSLIKKHDDRLHEGQLLN